MQWPWNRRAREKELDEEIEAHFRLAVQDQIDSGRTEKEAIEAARREFGNLGLVKETTRGMWGRRPFENLIEDLRYALRTFRKAPAFTITAVLTLAIGIGGTTAIFSLIHAVMLRSLPVADPGRLYRIGDGSECCSMDGPQDQWGMYPFRFVERLKAAAPEFEQIAAFQAGTGQFSVRRAGVDRIARAVEGEFVSGNYFSTLGIQPFAGRFFTTADDRHSSMPVAVLSYRAWTGIYAADPSVLGSTFVIEGHPFTIIGIAAPGFFGETVRADPPDLWLPLHQEPLLAGKASLLDQPLTAWLRVIGRLRPGASVHGLSARFTGVLRRWLRDDSGYPPAFIPELISSLPRQTIDVVPAGTGISEMKDRYGRSLTILLLVCGTLLLIACANLANLLLARAMARRSEVAARVALGASARRIVSQHLTESILLAVIGGTTGLAVAAGASRLLLALALRGDHFVPVSTAPSVPVLGFAFALSLLTGIVFGAAPAWFAAHTDPMDALRGAHRATMPRSFSRTAFLAVQAMLSVTLIAGAAMLARSLSNMEHQDLGFPTANRITAIVNLSPAAYTPERLEALRRKLQSGLAQVPGVERAVLALYNPLTGSNWSSTVYVAGRPMLDTRHIGSSWDRVSAGYLETLGLRIVRGRGFNSYDTGATDPVTVVNQSFAKKFFPSEDPLGKHFGIGMPRYANTLRIVGVVNDARFIAPDQPPQPMFFVLLGQYASYDDPRVATAILRSHIVGAVLLKTSIPSGKIEPLIKKVFAGADPDSTVLNAESMDQRVALMCDQQRAVAGLSGMFGIVALILAAIGLYGVTAYSVAQRTSEIGVRMALGADRAKVVRLVLQGAFSRVMVGLLLGIPLAIGAGWLLASQLYEVAPWDPSALLIAVVSLASAALIAAIIPARRAASIEPLTALRVE